MLKNTNSRQERTSSVRSEKVTNLAPTAGKDVTLKKCGGRISPHHVIFSCTGCWEVYPLRPKRHVMGLCQKKVAICS